MAPVSLPTQEQSRTPGRIVDHDLQREGEGGEGEGGREGGREEGGRQEGKSLNK